MMVSAVDRDGDTQKPAAEGGSGFSLFARKRKRSRKALGEPAAPRDTEDADTTPAQPCEERPAEGAPAAGEAEGDGTTFKDLGVSDWLCRCCETFVHRAQLIILFVQLQKRSNAFFSDGLPSTFSAFYYLGQRKQ